MDHESASAWSLRVCIEFHWYDNEPKTFWQWHQLNQRHNRQTTASASAATTALVDSRTKFDWIFHWCERQYIRRDDLVAEVNPTAFLCLPQNTRIIWCEIELVDWKIGNVRHSHRILQPSIGNVVNRFYALLWLHCVLEAHCVHYISTLSSGRREKRFTS